MKALKSSIRLGVVVLVGLATAANAVPLTDLIDGRTLQQGDKIFSSFGWSGSVGAEGIEVRGIGNGSEGNLFGILISGGGLSGLTAGSEGGATLSYAVETAAGSGMLMDAIHQNVAVFGSGRMQLQVVEDAFDAGGNQIATSTVGILVGWDSIDPPAELGDVLNFEPLSKIWIEKVISWDVLRSANEDPLSIRVKQTFSQVSVPDGGMTLMLLGIGCTVLGCVSRRRFTA